MTNMKKLEKVVDSLDLCLEVLCNLCPYQNSDAPGGCKDELMYDAMILLKERIPKVMTLKELTSLEENTPVYIEQYDGLHGWDVYIGVEIDTNDIMTEPSWDETEHWIRSEYGDTWRCWTSQPTEDQMIKEPWR